MWLGGYSYMVGIFSSLRAELWAVKVGLELAWEKGFRRVLLEVDSQVVVYLLNNGGGKMDSNVPW